MSIKRINSILFFLMIWNRLIFIILESNDLGKIYFLVFDLVILLLFILFNYSYYKEFEQSKNHIKDIIKSTHNNLLGVTNFYKENKDTNNIFNNLMLSKNILKKDYNDLEKLLYKFTPEYFLKEVYKKGIDRLELGMSIKKNVHVVFLDIIGFTSITEKIHPDRALLLLNIYFDGIVEIVKKYGGFIDKFLGDGMLIIFPFRLSDNVLDASIEIQKYIKNFSISEIGKNITVGIGINSGMVIMGTIGSRKRMEITIIGDTVNTASRIETLTRKHKNKIIISESTYKLAKNKEKFKIDYLGEKILKGKKIKKKIYGISELDN